MEVEAVLPHTFNLGFEPPEHNALQIPAAVATISPGSEYSAATKLQKMYRSYRTRRRLADTAVVAEELWWQVIDFARLNHSTVSFFNYSKPETAISRWNRVSLNASKVGQGLSKDGNALKLAFQHWIEAIDPRHRYGHNLHLYYEEWCKSQAGQPFFYWLDIGDGKDLDLKECSRSLLRKQCIKYLGPQEREHYEYVPIEGNMVHRQTGEPLDTTRGPEGAKWIFVMSTAKRFYAGQKKKGHFHHSSFLAGGATIAAGRFTAENGVLKVPASSNEDYYDDERKTPEEKVEFPEVFQPPQLELPAKVTKSSTTEPTAVSLLDRTNEARGSYRRTLSGGLQSPRADVSQKAIFERIKSKREGRSYQLGDQLSLKWCTGAGPRIGCVADYPSEVRKQALELVNLSPKVRAPLCVSPTSYVY